MDDTIRANQRITIDGEAEELGFGNERIQKMQSPEFFFEGFSSLSSDMTNAPMYLQDSASVHKAKMSQLYLEKNAPGHVVSKDWTSRRMDLNPRNYKSWAVSESMVCQ
ncbi:hypothetical protein TNCV_924701 [Trichonephila clavipes]|nr:hypothetical protein TNCV_924701 [Trichonephila clavipes]